MMEPVPGEVWGLEGVPKAASAAQQQQQQQQQQRRRGSTSTDTAVNVRVERGRTSRDGSQQDDELRNLGEMSNELLCEHLERRGLSTRGKHAVLKTRLQKALVAAAGVQLHPSSRQEEEGLGPAPSPCQSPLSRQSPGPRQSPSPQLSPPQEQQHEEGKQFSETRRPRASLDASDSLLARAGPFGQSRDRRYAAKLFEQRMRLVAIGDTQPIPNPPHKSANVSGHAGENVPQVIDLSTDDDRRKRETWHRKRLRVDEDLGTADRLRQRPAVQASIGSSLARRLVLRFQRWDQSGVGPQTLQK